MSRSRLVAELEEHLGPRTKVETKETSKLGILSTEIGVCKVRKPIRNGQQDVTALCARRHNAGTQTDVNRCLALGTYPWLELRVHAGVFVEVHGDLRLEHIFQTGPPVIFDRLEFCRTLHLVERYNAHAPLGPECSFQGSVWIGPSLIDALEPELGPQPGYIPSSLYDALPAILRALASRASASGDLQET